MKTIRTGILVGLLTVSCFTGCKENVVQIDDTPPGLYAVVIDPAGVALSGVEVRYLFYTMDNPLQLNARIQFSLASAKVVTLKILDPYGREVTTLINAQTEPAGVHSVQFDSAVTNAVYTSWLKVGDSVTTGEFFIRDDDLTRLQQKPSLTRTGQEGKFSLTSSLLRIGKTFPSQIAPNNDLILDSITVVLTKSGYKTFMETVRIDPSGPTGRSFTMQTN